MPTVVVGALVWCPGTSLEKLELGLAWLVGIFKRLKVDPLELEPVYGLLLALFLPRVTIEDEDDMRRIVWSRRCLPLSFGAPSIGIASEGSIST